MLADRLAHDMSKEGRYSMRTSCKACCVVNFLLVAACAAVLAVPCRANTVQRPFGAPSRHVPIKTMGRDHWILLTSKPYSDPYYEDKPEAWKGVWNNRELARLPAFRDCGLMRRTRRLPPDASGIVATWKTVHENCDPAYDIWDKLNAHVKPDKPMLLVLSSKRHVLSLAGDVALDREDWAEFKRANTNMVGVLMLGEWGNNIVQAARKFGVVSNHVRRANLEAVYSRHRMDNRHDRLALTKWYFDRLMEIQYDDRSLCWAERSGNCLDHCAAAWGASTLVLEASNTAGADREYRWDVDMMFIRGAARQFAIPWGWYEASYFNGYKKDGTWVGDCACDYITTSHRTGPHCGTAASAQRRVWYFSYLNGSNSLQSEDWWRCFFTAKTPSKKAELTERGRNFCNFYDFTMRHPGRGVAYAPVAILIPFSQGYVTYGGMSWDACPYTDGDRALDALFFTIAPGWERDKGLRAGIHEGNLHNSRFALMYDVLVPDSPQPAEDFAKALFSYPAAILVGDYPDENAFAGVLAKYEKSGGRLVRLKSESVVPKCRFGEIQAGRVRFDGVEKLLMQLQNEYFPFEVSGDCQYGACKTETGWWLWAFNNKGVRKFADTPETFDSRFDSTICVRLKGNVLPVGVTELISERRLAFESGSFRYCVRAGDLAVFEVKTHGGQPLTANAETRRVQ